MADFFVGNNDKIDFQDLMGHRVHEILLVASPYDAFILEDFLKKYFCYLYLNFPKTSFQEKNSLLLR